MLIIKFFFCNDDILTNLTFPADFTVSKNIYIYVYININNILIKIYFIFISFPASPDVLSSLKF